MARCSRLARRPALAVFAAALSCAACASAAPGNGSADPGPFQPPAAVAAGPNGQVTSQEVAAGSIHHSGEMLQGRFAGVEVTQLAAGGISVHIRGVTSLVGSNEPLYVVDGIPVEPEPGGALRWIAPQDIDRIEVLKDPAETAMYGVRGANGVVVITLKH